MKNHSEYRKDRNEPVDETKKAIQHNFYRQKVSKQNNYSLQNQVTTKLKSWLGDCSGRI